MSIAAIKSWLSCAVPAFVEDGNAATGTLAVEIMTGSVSSLGPLTVVVTTDV